RCLPAHAAYFARGRSVNSENGRPWRAAANKPAALGRARCRLRRSTADDANQQDDDGHDEQNVDEPTNRVRGHQPQQPEYDEDNGNRIKHWHSLLFELRCRTRRSALRTLESV